MDLQFGLGATFFLTTAIAASSCTSHAIGEGKTEREADVAIISTFVPNATSIRLEQQGDLDMDGDADALVVLEKAGDTPARHEPRTLLIFLRGKNGNLEKAATGPNAILCQSCGGTMGDPLQGIDIGPGSFTLRFEGGSRELWQREYRFAHSPEARTWMLDAIDNKTLDRMSGDSEGNQIDAPGQNPVSIDEFDPSDMLEEMDA